MDEQLRVAYLMPSVELGAYWQPVLAELAKEFRHFVFYTGRVWPGFDPETPEAKVIKIVGQMKSLEFSKTEGYSRRVMLLSPGIVGHLLRFRPHVVFSQAYSLWTLLAMLFKPLGGWRLVIAYEGSTPNTDFRDSTTRSLLRRLMSRYADAFVANNHRAKEYLIDEIGASEESIFTKAYLVPDAQALQKNLQEAEPTRFDLKRPIFLYVGQLTPRKGIRPLLEACALLEARGYHEYSLVVVGAGEQREELEAFARDKGLNIRWAGWVAYGRLGSYFKQADVFVFPTFEDTWGMAVLEAMVFGKPVLCSRLAGAAEMIVEGENGYLFDPRHPEELARAMRRLLDAPELLDAMSSRSAQLIASTTPRSVAECFAEVVDHVMRKSRSSFSPSED